MAAPFPSCIAFNPTLVQFKLKAGNRRTVMIGHFQSYLSPIQTGSPGGVPPQGPGFQSYLSPIQTRKKSKIVKVFASTFQSYLSPIQTG